MREGKFDFESAEGMENLEQIREVVKNNMQRIAELGQWPAHIKPDSLLERIPHEDKNAPGFDAGIACALDLIPGDKQELAGKLHANYTKDAVLQVRKELADNNPDSSTTWWLAASSLCTEHEVDSKQFLNQIEEFKKLVADDRKRMMAAEKMYDDMAHSFTLKNGTPYGEKDGCIQAAYIAGYPYGTLFTEKYKIYFIGTYEDSLGLENFQWSEEKDAKGRPNSGPVHGSKQFVKCANEDEWKRAIEVIKTKLSEEEKSGM